MQLLRQEIIKCLFFIAVKTNVGYSIVADFVVQEEMIEQILEALWVV